MRFSVSHLVSAAIVLAASAATADQPTFKSGSAIDLSSLSAAEWIKGEAPKAFEPGKVYIFECWATWCGGCVEHIPRLNELHGRFHDKGLLIYGMDVWEDDREKVAEFVRKKGDGMSYPVAFTGKKGSPFDLAWLQPACQYSIPHAFIVKDGKLALGCSPHYLTDKVVTALLDPATFDQTIATMSGEAVPRELFDNARFKFEMAARKKDPVAMEAALADCERAKPEEPLLVGMKLDLRFAKKDWQGALAFIKELPRGAARDKQLLKLGERLAYLSPGLIPSEFTAPFAGILTETMRNSTSQPEPHAYVHLAVIQWRNGSKDEAGTTLERAVLAAKEDAETIAIVPALEKFAASLKAGVLPTVAELRSWEREKS